MGKDPLVNNSVESAEPVRRSALLYAWLPPLAWMALIFWLSSQSHPMFIPQSAWRFDKLLHAGAYGVLGALLQHALWRQRSKHAGFWAWLIAAAYGTSDEWHQSFVPQRSCDVFDWIADAVGAGLATVFFSVLCRLAPRFAPGFTAKIRQSMRARSTKLS